MRRNAISDRWIEHRAGSEDDRQQDHDNYHTHRQGKKEQTHALHRPAVLTEVRILATQVSEETAHRTDLALVRVQLTGTSSCRLPVVGALLASVAHGASVVNTKNRSLRTRAAIT